jgi:hypothetical protein
MSYNFQDAVTHIVQLVNDFDWTKNYWSELHSEFGDVQPAGWDTFPDSPRRDEQNNPCPYHGIFEFEFEPTDTDWVVNCKINTQTRELLISMCDETYSCAVSQEIADAILEQKNETFFIAKEWLADRVDAAKLARQLRYLARFGDRIPPIEHVRATRWPNREMLQ